ncbi:MULTISPECIES: hypothetical protein [Streptomyces]|uniref:Uncharacterized protein n=2 Tax=Streptomyces TaxID=1883 RepID=A0A1E7LPP0_9ACTN|nr:hypothetical protein [Streptomyces nanshensis]OEV18160.1 hypothetical protein AN221_23755 [Streptomyces nanshensis]
MLGRPSLAGELNEIRRRLGVLERAQRNGGSVERFPYGKLYPMQGMFTLPNKDLEPQYAVDMSGVNNPVAVIDVRVSVADNGSTRNEVQVTPQSAKGARGPLLRAYASDMAQVGNRRYATWRFLWGWPGAWGWEDGDGSTSFEVLAANKAGVGAFGTMYQPAVSVVDAATADALGKVGTVFKL